ncbi:hypothetical protein QBC42DRAFT_215750 [Cladorrhinum samala]|uniref:C2 domain-containing protein n=1 Tax=Cladorrhinum samala TaxID=585594 RepID=A0AAV9I4D2_9PEZI|nr:hypothetical protein QBC42DRAFT_215750 [Cladorrhinum samala]
MASPILATEAHWADAGFLNEIVKHLWPNINAGACAMIKQIAEPMFGTMLPAPLNSLFFQKIDLGAVPLVFSNIDVHKIENGIKLDLDVDWQGQCDIELNGGSLIPKIGVEHVKLSGRLSILLCPLTNVIPLIGAAQVAFINRPSLTLVYTDAANIANISALDSGIRNIVLSIISSMAVLPNRFFVKLDPTTDWFRAYQHPEGILRLTVESAQNLGEESKSRNFLKKLVHDVPDCFAKVKAGGVEWKTNTVKNNRHPEWNQTQDFLISDEDQVIEVDVQDDDTLSDDDVGVAGVSVKTLMATEARRLELDLVHKGEKTGGQVTVRGQWLQLVPEWTAPAEVPQGEIVGLVTVLVARVLGIEGRRQDLKPAVSVTWGTNKFQTGVPSDSPGVDLQNPSYDVVYRVPITAGMTLSGSSPIRFALLNAGQETAAVDVSLDEVLAAPGLSLESEFAFSGSSTKVRAGIYVRGTRTAQ